MIPPRARVITHKFHAVPCERDDIRFPSKAERKRYDSLKLLKASGQVLFWIRQPQFDLPGSIVYRADFLVFWADGSVTIEDVKGHETPEFKLKKKMLEENYPFELTIIK